MLQADQILQNRYRIIRVLGKGGFGAVYEAREVTLNISCVIKEMFPPSDPSLVKPLSDQFLREARTLATLSHPNLPRVTHYFEENGNFYLVMDLVRGQNLDQLIVPAGMPEAIVLKYADQLLDVLEYIHSEGVIHRDIKPPNIIIQPNGRAMLVDFGLVKSFTSTTAGVSMRALSPYYAPPEQYTGGTDERSDLYSLAATIYHSLSGQRPMSAAEQMSGTRLTPLRQLQPSITENTDAVIMKALKLDRNERYPSAQVMRTALSVTQPSPAPSPAPLPAQPTAILQSDKQPVRRAPIAQPTRVVPQRNSRLLIVLGAAVLVVVLLASALAVWQIANPPPASGPNATPPTQLPTRTPEQSAEAKTVMPSTSQSPVADETFTPLPLSTPASTGTGGRLRIGLVTDTGGVNDKSINQSAWAGVQKAAQVFDLDASFIETKQPADYAKNIDQFAAEHYDVIITVGFLMADDTAAKAIQYPNIKFAIVDSAYYPTSGAKVCDETKKDCYSDGGLKNVTSLMFQEDEIGFLAGVVAAGISRSGTVCTVAGIEIPPVVKYVTGYESGAKWMNPNARTLHVYVPTFNDPAKGAEVANGMIDEGCDVVFVAAGNTGNGGLLAAKEKGLAAIGVDVDQYYTYPEVQEALVTSAAKNADVAVYEYLESVSARTDKAGVVTANLKNNGIGLAPYHDWENKVPPSIKAMVRDATNGLKNGTITTGYKP